MVPRDRRPSAPRPSPRPPPVAPPTPTRSRRWESWRFRAPARRSGSERYQLVVHLDADALPREGEGRANIEDGPALSPEAARRLACDASLMALLERDGAPPAPGRRTRKVPPRLRRSLQARDRGCRFPGCERCRFVDAHHIHHWADGGETSADNLLLLCRHHHRLVHEGGFRIERHQGGEIRFRHRRGALIPAHPPSPRGDRARLYERSRRAGHSIDSSTCLSGSGRG